MNRAFLVTMPNYDDATSYLFSYAKIVAEHAEKINIKTIDLKRPRLTRENFTSLVLKQDPLLIFFNAHGSESAIYGDKISESEEILVEENENHYLLKNRIVYARACWAARSLGMACVAGAGGCFIGYKTPFSFWIDEKWSAKPLNDKTAKLFLEPSNLIVESLLKGNSAEEAVDKSLNMSKKNIMKLLRAKDEPGAVASIMLLWSNIEGQEILGDRDIIFG